MDLAFDYTAVAMKSASMFVYAYACVYTYAHMHECVGRRH